MKRVLWLVLLFFIVLFTTGSASAYEHRSVNNSVNEPADSVLQEFSFNNRAYYIRQESFEDKSYAGHVTMKALQGIVNRESPQLFIIGSSYAYTKTDEEWFRYYRDELGIQFTELHSIYETIVTFKDYFKGIITFNTSVKSYNGWISPLADTAVVLAGLTATLPVSEGRAAYYSAVTGLPILDEVELRAGDKRKKVAGHLGSLGLSEINEIYNWQVDNLMEFANPREFMALTWEGLDFAVQRKMIFIDTRTKSNLESRELEAKVLEYFGSKNDVFYVWGWTEDEYFGVHAISKAGGYLRNIATGNLSFHAVVPSNISVFKQKSNVKPDEFQVDKDKFYILFMVSEADTNKAAVSFNHGGYVAEGRGSVAINWGLPANTIEDFPAVAEYYMKTATENDYFFTSGGHYGGYIDMASVPERTKPALFEEAKVWMEKADQPYLDYFSTFVFSEYQDINRQVYADYAKNVGVLGLIGRDKGGRTTIDNWDGVLSIDRYYSYPSRTKADDKLEIAKGDFHYYGGTVKAIEKDDNFIVSDTPYDYMIVYALVNFEDTTGLSALRGFISEDCASYYEVRIVDGERIDVVKCIDGDETILSTTDVWISRNTDYELRLYLDGSRVQVVFGERGSIRYIADVEDTTLKSGRHGIYTTNPNVTFTNYGCVPKPAWKEVYDNIVRETIGSNRNGGVCVGFYGLIVHDDYTTNQFKAETIGGQWMLMTPTTLKMVMDELEKNYPGKFEAVTLDKFMAAAAEFAQAEVELIKKFRMAFQIVAVLFVVILIGFVLLRARNQKLNARAGI